MKRFGAFTAGAAMGLLMGLMVGLSGSPVVGAVVAGLITLLATFFGFRSPDAAATVEPQTGGTDGAATAKPHIAETDVAERVVTVMGFGLMAAIGALLGLYIRTHGALSPTPHDRVQRWMQAGFDTARAQALVEFELTGLVPDSTKVTAPQPTRTTESILFSGERVRCDQVDAENLADAASMLRAFRAAEGEWRAIAEASAGLPEDAQRRILLGAWRLACRVS